ncbi:hypothetical protein niasHT_000156 [Heterodera trifolii]|uniref:BTB domain-containing protein n=1 Tax=Heterodera trifolii TaxID=157864 RepID=A0ABD2LQ78_9BILA
MPSSKPGNLVDRMKLLLSEGENADVHFLVGKGKDKELLLAHKLILNSASDVFEAMFRFDSQNQKWENVSSDKPVEVTDVGVDAFKTMLEFIYSDDLSGLNGDNAIEVFYAAKKYNIPGLFTPCLQVPIPKLHNVFLAYAQARLFDLEALRWADEQCLQNGIECSAKSRRSMLGPALFKIRFPLIPKEDFSQSIFPSDVLTLEEVIGIYQFHCHSNLCDVPGGRCLLQFSTRQRISDRHKGTLVLEIDHFLAFTRQTSGFGRYSNAVYIRGLPWQMLAKVNIAPNGTEKFLGVFLSCQKTDINWHYSMSAILRILSQKNGTEDLMGNFDSVFDNKSNSIGYPNFIAFKELMNPGKGLYDKDEDKVTLTMAIGVKADNTKTDKS